LQTSADSRVAYRPDKPADLGPESRYLEEASSRLGDLLGDGLVGIYAGGSYALGGYLPGRSDLDLAAVVSAPLLSSLKQAVVEGLRHESLPCPARALELVVYRRETVGSTTATADFELNLNTGAGVRLQGHFGPEAVGPARHWFPIDRSVLAQAGIALYGPPADRVFARIPPATLMPTLVDSVRWHRLVGGELSDAVLNACRALRFATDGRWSSKAAAGRWASERRLVPSALAERAYRARNEPVGLDGDEVDRFLRAAESRLAAQAFGSR
jgi:hypothetical protein